VVVVGPDPIVKVPAAQPVPVVDVPAAQPVPVVEVPAAQPVPVVEVPAAQPPRAAAKPLVVQVDTRPLRASNEQARIWHPEWQQDCDRLFGEANQAPPKLPFWAVTALHNASVCRRAGWDHRYHHLAECADRHPAWLKIRHVLDSWDGWVAAGRAQDWVMVLDTDAWLRDPQGLLAALAALPAKTLFVSAQQLPAPVPVAGGAFLCFRLCEPVRALFQAAWDAPGEQEELARFRTEWPWDAAALGHLRETDAGGCRAWMQEFPVTAANTPAGTLVAHCWMKDLVYDLALDDLLSGVAREATNDPNPSLEFVLARCRGEDVSWVYSWLPFVDRVTVYDASAPPPPQPQPVAEPPAGEASPEAAPPQAPALPPLAEPRFTHPKLVVLPFCPGASESRVFAHHFASRYDDLCDTTVCCPGRYTDFMTDKDFQRLVRTGEAPVVNGLDIKWWEKPEGAAQTTAKFFMTHVHDDLVSEDQVVWWPHDAFRATRAAVHRREKARYETLARALTGTGEATLMRRCWNALLN
jgi:hypothetical protein